MCYRITLEDDSDEEELDVEPAQRRPVLVMSDSLREGLQRGIDDILPHMVAQSVWVFYFQPHYEFLVYWTLLKKFFLKHLNKSCCLSVIKNN